MAPVCVSAAAAAASVRPSFSATTGMPRSAAVSERSLEAGRIARGLEKETDDVDLGPLERVADVVGDGSHKLRARRDRQRETQARIVVREGAETRCPECAMNAIDPGRGWRELGKPQIQTPSRSL